MNKQTWPFLLGIMSIGLAIVIGSAKPVVEEGDTITLDYILSLEDGTIFYSSVGHEPLRATLNQGELIPGFEEAVMGMRIGETKTFTIPPEKAYGNYRPEMIGTFDRGMFPEDVVPEIGKQIQANLKDGTQAVAIITSFTDTTVTLDANHPLVGQTLTFEINLLGIGNDTTPASSFPVWLGWVIFVFAATIAMFQYLRAKTPQLARVVKRRVSVR